MDLWMWYDRKQYFVILLVKIYGKEDNLFKFKIYLNLVDKGNFIIFIFDGD